MTRALLLATIPLVFAAASAVAQDPASQPAGATAAASTAPKSPNTARTLAIIPSAGHFYAGQPGRGLLFLGGMAGALVIGVAGAEGDCLNTLYEEDCGSAPLQVATIAFLGLYGWSIYDAGRAAHRTNRRRGTPVSVLISPTRAAVSSTRDVPAAKLGVRMAVR